MQNQPQMMGLSCILNEGEDGLLKVLSLKADQNDLEKLHEMKSNKVDTENLIDLILEMNRILQHIIVLQNETLRVNLIKANDTRLARENRSHELIIQAHALSQWALRFDVKKRLEDEILLQNNSVMGTSSVESDITVNKPTLSNAQTALKKSIAGAKVSTQRRYRSPIRQKDRIANNRGFRIAASKDLFDFAPADVMTARQSYNGSKPMDSMNAHLATQVPLT